MEEVIPPCRNLKKDISLFRSNLFAKPDDSPIIFPGSSGK